MDESGEEIKTTNSEKLGVNYENSTPINGSDEGVKVCDDDKREKSNDDPIPESSNSPSSVGLTKGKGLRKWKRIKRDGIKDGTSGIDSSKPLKRGSSGSGPNPARGQKSEGSLSSTGAVVNNIKNDLNLSNLDLKLDSENSEDQSSISSTAASGSVWRNGGGMAVMRESKGVNGVQQKKGPVKSKKARGEKGKFEKENSVTSILESDSRSSNFVFVQGTDSVGINGIKSGKVGNYVDGNSDDEAENGEKIIIDEVGDGNSKENGGKLEDLGDGENQSSATEMDPLAESILKLQSAQDALEKEIQKFREMGDETQETTDENVHEASSSEMFILKKNAGISPHYLKTHVNNLKRNVDVPETKLEEPNSVLKAKEAEVTKPDSEEIEAEIEDLFRHKLEAEFQYLAISEVVEKMKIDLLDQAALSDELKTTLNVVRDAENNVNLLKIKAENLETRVEETVEIEQVSELQKRVRQVTSCLFIQFILLFLVFISFVLHFSPHTPGVVPT